MKWCPNDACPFLLETGSRSTFEDKVDACLDCRTPLASGEPAALRAAGPREPARLEVVATFAHIYEAESAKTHLEEHGIPAWVEPLPRLVPAENEARFEVRVRAADSDAARRTVMCAIGDPADELPEDFDLDGQAEALNPVCPKCGRSDVEWKDRRPSRWSALFGQKPGQVRVCRGCGTELDD